MTAVVAAESGVTTELFPSYANVPLNIKVDDTLEGTLLSEGLGFIHLA